MEPDRIEVYRTLGELELALHLFYPPDESPQDRVRPGILFFFGGGWARGTVRHFYPQARFLAEQGMVAACAEYRVASVHGTTPLDAVQDALAAIRWMREHYLDLGLDPARLAAGGGSAGGHLAACTALLAEPEQAPQALILYNPVLDTTENGFCAKALEPDQRLGISPCHLVRSSLPPTLIMHGTEDTVAPCENAEDFTFAMQAAGNDCALILYDGRGHGFFNPRADAEAGGPDFQGTLLETRSFLRALGWIGPSAG